MTKERITPPTLEQVRYERCRRSCKYFITNFVRIEDRDAATRGEGIAIPFTLWPKQEEALNHIISERLLLVLKARQLGLTWLALSYAVWCMLFHPGYSVVMLSKREDDAKELVRRAKFILENLPSWMTKEKKGKKRYSCPVWEATALNITIYQGKLESSVMTGMTSAPDSARSFTSNLVILDEWAFHPWAEELWTAAYPTINRPAGGQVIGISTNKRGSMFEKIAKIPDDYGFTRVFLPWTADPRRDSAWYETTKKALPNTYMQEYPTTPEEAFSAGESTAFPEFTELIHVCRPFAIPSFWKRWRANDPGYADPFAWYWFAVSHDGIVYIYREYTREPNDPRVTYSDQAREVIKLSSDENISFTVVGRDAWNKLGRALESGQSEGKSIIDCYHEGGLTGCIPPPTSQETARKIRKAVWHEYLKPFEDELSGRTIAKVQIFNTCKALINAMPNLVVDENDFEKVAKEPHIYTNPYDGAGYGLVAWHAKHSKVPEGKKTTIQRDKEKLAKKLMRPKKRIV